MKRHNARGFSVIELMVAMTIGLMTTTSNTACP